MIGRARSRAAAVLTDTIELFQRVGYREAGRPAALEALLDAPVGRQPLCLRLAPQGKIFGGNYGLEIGTAESVLPASRGLRARGRGIVRLRGIAFRPRRGDEVGRRLAARLQGDPALAEALARVHFDRIWVEPDGRAVIRHLGGSVVWFLFPPLVRSVPLVPEQVRATLAALEAFARAGRE